MLTLLICLYGIWILPLVFVVRLFHQPVDLSMREHTSAPTTPSLRRGIHVQEWMILVFLMSVDCSITMAIFPAESALILLAGDMVMILIPVVIATFVFLTRIQDAALTLLLAFIVLRTVAPMFR
jgi:hypothetical protein